MRLEDLYKKLIEIGITHDPRGKATVLKDLESTKKEYETLKASEKGYFDQESLKNPYPDSRVLYGSLQNEIRDILVGIDIDVGEILIADNLKTKGHTIDLLLSHHPSGKAFANLYSVMHMQSDILNLFGVPINIAEGLMEKRIREVERKLMPSNHARTIDAARLMNIPLMCMHTPADNMVSTYLQKMFDAQKPDKVSDVLDMLMKIPEYQFASQYGVGPKIVTGSRNRKVEKVFVDMTGGTEGAKEIFERLTNSGVGTIVGMHISEEHRQEAEKNYINVIVAGHISSDNLGLNLLLDEIIKTESLEISEFSGFKRFTHSHENN